MQKVGHCRSQVSGGVGAGLRDRRNTVLKLLDRGLADRPPRPWAAGAHGSLPASARARASPRGWRWLPDLRPPWAAVADAGGTMAANTFAHRSPAPSPEIDLGRVRPRGRPDCARHGVEDQPDARHRPRLRQADQDLLGHRPGRGDRPPTARGRSPRRRRRSGRDHVASPLPASMPVDCRRVPFDCQDV